MRPLIFALLLPLLGCGGEADMKRLLKQIKYNSAQERKADFPPKADQIVAQIQAKNLNYLIANTGYAARKEVGQEGLKKYYKEQIFTHVANNFTYQRKGRPKVQFDEYSNYGYGFNYKVSSDDCNGTLFVAVLLYKEQIQIRGLSFKDLKGSGCV